MILHSFVMADVEDPEIYAAGPIIDWQNSEEGKWVMENVIEQPCFHITVDNDAFVYKVIITGKLTPEATIFFTLKFK
jgi:hypothetical protein